MINHNSFQNETTLGFNHAVHTIDPVPFVVEAVPGGFIVSGVGGRQVARNVHQVARLLREWAPKEPKKEAKPE